MDKNCEIYIEKHYYLLFFVLFLELMLLLYIASTPLLCFSKLILMKQLDFLFLDIGTHKKNQGWHSIAAEQHKGPGFDPKLGLLLGLPTVP